MAPSVPTPLAKQGGRRARPGKARSAAAAGCGAVRVAEVEARFAREISDARVREAPAAGEFPRRRDSAYTDGMAGMKYSPGFDNPSARPRTARSKGLVVVATVLSVAALGLTFMAYLSPSLMVDLGSVMLLCAQAIGLR